MNDSVKKGFLQAAINHGALKTDKIYEVITPILEYFEIQVPADLNALKEFVNQVSADLSDMNQALTFVKHPLDGEEYLVFHYTTETPICKHQQHYSESDRYYFAKLLEALVNSEEYGISWVEIYSVANAMTPAQKQISKNRIQDLVQKWSEQGYFLEKDDMFYFGPRMMVEYASHLKAHYPELVKDCPLCGTLVYWDVKCSECGIKVHRDCIRKYLIKRSNCPACEGIWSTRLD